jgi:hypothetical protein
MLEGRSEGMEDIGPGSGPIGIKKTFGKELLERGKPKKMRCMRGGYAEECTQAFRGGGDKEESEGGCAEVVLKVPGEGVFVVSVKFRLERNTAFISPVDLQKKGQREGLDVELTVAVWAKSQAVFAEGVPESVIGLNPGSKLARTRTAGLNKEFAVCRLNQKEMRDGTFSHVYGTFAVG